MTNIGYDLSDSIALLYVFTSIDATLFPKQEIESLDEDEDGALEKKLDADLQKLGIQCIMGDHHLHKSNAKVNILLCTLIVLKKHGIRELHTIEEAPYADAKK